MDLAVNGPATLTPPYLAIARPASWGESEDRHSLEEQPAWMKIECFLFPILNYLTVRNAWKCSILELKFI
jgi:hypothetical protein